MYKLIQELYSNLLEDPTNSETSQVEWGLIKKSFAKFMKERFEQEFGPSAKNITNLNEAEIKRINKKLIEKDLMEYSKQFKGGNLGDYSPWLKEFKRNLAKDIEIPGQFNGKSKPMPEYHVKIESFDERDRKSVV